MKSRDFCYWLQGYFEVTSIEQGNASLSADQVECIRNHLNMVFVHEIDPSFPAQQKPALDKAHFGGTDPITGGKMRC